MRTVTYQSVLQGAARLLGLDPLRDLNAQTAARLTEYINRAVAKGWRFEQWPEWTITEQRWYRPIYSPTMTVTGGVPGLPAVGGTEVYYPPADAYYQALQYQNPAVQPPAIYNAQTGTWVENSAFWAASTQSYSNAAPWTPNTAYGVGQASGLAFQAQNPNDGLFYQCIVPHTSGASWDASKWALLTGFTKSISYTQPGRTVIWEAPSVCAFRRDPRVYPERPWPVRTQRNDAGILFGPEAVNSVWLQFWTTPPQFTSTLYSATTAYAAGVTIYDGGTGGTGDCWTSTAATTAGQSPTSTPSKWQRIQFPFVLSAYAKRMAMADGLRDQKQTSRADDEEARAADELQDEADKALAGQGIYETATVAVAPSPGIW